ncbi:MAG TPA: crosslink repair DNA glycosylase YcaQ family protein [Ideonella sp.]|nr:crosslink repair DNA glycosylase YcaQ family protein [Ideonella sp.]
MPRPITLDDLRRHAVARTLFAPTTLERALGRLGFVQADPIRAPARAQDLTLRHRVAGYRAGDLERRYPRLAVEEDCLVNYGFLPRAHLALLHPRVPARAWDAATARRAADVLAFVRERGPTHPREVERSFAHGRTRNWFGGTSNVATQLLDAMHYRGLLRVVRREGGTRVYAAAAHPPGDDSAAGRAGRAAALVDLVVAKYAPLPAASLTYLVRLLVNYGAPQLAAETRAALRAARQRLAGSRVDGVDWIWPAGEDPRSARHRIDDAARLLAPFDPIVWDRARFELLWGWRYRFEAYTPPARRTLGYYALPLLWRERVIGWANVARGDGAIDVDIGYAAGRAPRDTALGRALDAERALLAHFLGLDDRTPPVSRPRESGRG